MSDSTEVYLPKNLPYPLTIIKINVNEGDEISKHSPVITYKYFDFEPVPVSEQEEEKTDESDRKLVKVEYVGSYECPLEGKVSSIDIKIGDKIKNNELPILQITELCTHPIQYGGLCALCGKSIEEEDIKDRAPISMTHGTTNLKVSSKEAENIEKSSTQRLLKEEKLSLVVDLDQTVIHATVDPTVGEWMADPTNPNYDAIKDVKSFTLEEPAIPPPGYTGPPLPPNIRWYYVKLRPGLQNFLEKLSQMYEMHIYTMATRQYAKSIAKIIDPDGIYFGDRILSRDESGSLTQKSLKRLFPVDTSMVVVIDDRGDVWNWSPNLIKVVPYDFFVGIGDINSSFLPRQQALLGPSKRRKSVNILEEQYIEKKTWEILKDSIQNNEEEAIQDDEDTEGDKNSDASNENNENNEDNENNENNENNEINNSNDSNDSNTDENQSDKIDSHNNGIVVVTNKSSSPIDRMIELTDGGENSELLAVQENERSTALEQQEQERPLAKLQENLDKIIEEEEEEATTPFNKRDINEGKSTVIEPKETHNLLNDDDTELETLGQALLRIHNEFYFEIERCNQSSKLPDVKDIMTSMKNVVFYGFTFLLSGVLPLGTPLAAADIVIWSKSFGATFVTEYNTKVTHVICKNSGTFKVRLAKSVDPDVKIVNPDWLFACMSVWDKVPEDNYIVQVDSLLSKEQVDDFLKYHSDDKLFDTANLDWGEIDDEMKEFMGSDYEGEDLDESESEDNATEKTSSSKRTLEDENKDGENVDGAKKQKIEDAEPQDDFERDLLEHLADLE